MTEIKLLNKIGKAGVDRFDGAKYTLSEDAAAPAGILVRSAAMHEMAFGPELLAIARAGAGVNNIPLDRCSEQGIVVFNTPGANANGVKELALAALLLSSRKIDAGIAWAKTLKGQEGVEKLVEKGKSAFVGPELLGKTLGVIGLGAIGGLVANAAVGLGMQVVGCDPFITVNAAWSLSRAVRKADNYDEIYADADYITIHVPSTPDTKGMINAETIAKMKDGVRIINLARGDLVDNAAVKAALLGPTAVAIHDDGNVLGDSARIECVYVELCGRFGKDLLQCGWSLAQNAPYISMTSASFTERAASIFAMKSSVIFWSCSSSRCCSSSLISPSFLRRSILFLASRRALRTATRRFSAAALHSLTISRRRSSVGAGNGRRMMPEPSLLGVMPRLAERMAFSTGPSRDLSHGSMVMRLPSGILMAPTCETGVATP